MKRTVLRLAIFVLLLVPRNAVAKSPVRNPLNGAQADAVDAAIGTEMARQKAIGVAIGVIRDGEIVYLKGYGLADRENKTPVDTETVFNWASNCKPLAAVAVMQLREKNLIDLDADVRTYVPEFPEKTSVITIRKLLCHQSGIPHYDGAKVIATERIYRIERPFEDPVLALDKFNRSALLFEPGAQVHYSTHAYVLLSAAVQKAGRESFGKQIEERIAKPLGMKSWQLDVESDHQPHWSVGYTKNKAGTIAPIEEANYWKFGGGGYKSNVEDFARWAQAVINRRLLSEESQKTMWTPQATNDGTMTTWGLGFVVEQDGQKVLHGGRQEETTTFMELYPKLRQGVVVMCNCGYVDPKRLSSAVYTSLK